MKNNDIIKEFITKMHSAEKRGESFLILKNYASRFSSSALMQCTIEIASLSKTKDHIDKIFDEIIPGPKIGAALVIGDDVYFSARSGLKHGDHAEFTILEKLCSHISTKGGILYTTLEPCTDESRSPWTESCSKLIINKEISKVFIGTLDENPLVTGVGVNTLLNAGVEVEFYSKNFKDKLYDLNNDFFDFCKKYPDYKLIKKIDDAFKEHLDRDAISKYLGVKKITIDHLLEFYRKMVDKKQIIDGCFPNTVTITNDFALCFLKKPSLFIPGFSINLIDKTTNKSAKARIKKALDKSLISLLNVNNNNNLLNIIFKTIDNSFDENNFQSSFISAYSYPSVQILRELLVNAIVHNDFSQPSIFIEINNDCLKIYNFDKDGDKIVDRLNGFNMTSFQVNPALLEFFIDAKIAENENTCMNLLYEKNVNNNEKIYSFDSESKKIITTIKLIKQPNQKNKARL